MTAAFAGLSLERALDRPRVMAIVNVTPDSFSDGGERLDPAQAIDDGLRFVPRAPTSSMSAASRRGPARGRSPAEEELRRILPVVEGLARRGVLVSIDTRRASRGARRSMPARASSTTSRRCATIPTLMPLVAERGVPVVLMHRRGRPEDKYDGPAYGDVVEEVTALPARARRAPARPPASRASASRSIPASASARASTENVALIAGTARLADAGYPVLVGASRKGFIGRLTGIAEPRRRAPASVWLAVEAARRGAAILRVHDVAATRQALAVSSAMR